MASRERDDAMAGLLKHGLARDAGAANDCPAPDILAAYFERSLDREEEAAIELHFSKCAHCREQFAALDRAEQGVAAAALDAPTAAKAPRASWLWDWRWLAPVAAMLVITAIWATRRPALTHIAEHPTAASSDATPEPAPPPAPSAAPEQQQVRPAPRQAAPEVADKITPQKTEAPRSSVPQAPQSAPAFGGGAANGTGAPVTSAEESAAPDLVAPKSVENLPLNGRNYTELKKLPEAPSAAKAATADEASNAPAPAQTNESVTVESAAAPAPEPASTPSSGATVGGTASGVVGAQLQSSTAKQSLARAYRDRAEIVSANQAGEPGAANVILTPDPRILWRIATGGFVERSEDGGITWKGQLPNQNAHFTAGSAPGAKVCWLVGDDGIILLTEDASNWATIPPPARADFAAVRATSASSATVTTTDGRKFITANRGKTWKLVD